MKLGFEAEAFQALVFSISGESQYTSEDKVGAQHENRAVQQIYVTIN